MKNVSSSVGESSGRVERLHGSVSQSHYRVALAGNPNTGKSTVFNHLTGLRQHTGNWPGKTVARMEGAFRYRGEKYTLVDLPGTYSLAATSEDEEIARDALVFGDYDAVVLVADATRMERNFNFILQVLSVCPRVVICLNLMDEARRNRISIDVESLSAELGVPVVGTSARSGKGMDALVAAVHAAVVRRSESVSEEESSSVGAGESRGRLYEIADPWPDLISEVEGWVESLYGDSLPNRGWVSQRLLEGDVALRRSLGSGALRHYNSGVRTVSESDVEELLVRVDALGAGRVPTLSDAVMSVVETRSRALFESTVELGYSRGRAPFDIWLDRVVTHRFWGFVIMILLLAGVLWITIVGSNYPSGWLMSTLVDRCHPWLADLCGQIGMPWWLKGFLVDGVYLTMAWVVSVMLPPMAIFFPLFTLLEDFGYLPRVAFNLDSHFNRVGAHGKQALTMCMGFGCNAAGVVATRIIDSPRERLIAIITNNYSLCNGRWPTQIALASMFLAVLVPSVWGPTVALGAVLVVALLGVLMMFLSSWLLSRTLLRGEISTFHLELPPYRPPRLLQTIYTSIVHRTLQVLWRAIMFAAPAGAILWLCSNIPSAENSISSWLIDFLNPFGVLLGLNGVILLAYIFAIPANEIVIPTILMLIVLTTGSDAGAGAGVLFEDETVMAALFSQNGWTTLTAVNLMLFSLLHNPCSTTIYTIYKETGSLRWTAVATFLPVLQGMVLCAVVALIWRAIGG